MKKFLLGVGVIVILVSCASFFPEPESNTDSLVIGSFIIDFPDGFGSYSPLTAAEGIKLYFTNLTRNRHFVLVTDSDGYYYYLTNGSDEYVLNKFECPIRPVPYADPIRYTLNIPIRTSTTKLIYMGHISITFSELLVTTITIHPQYEVALHVDWDRTAMLLYLENRQSDACWLDYDIIHRFVYFK